MMDRERPSASDSEGRIPEAWIGQEVMIETTEVLSSDLRASAPVYLEDVNDRGVVMLVTRHRDQNQFSRYFYPWSVVGWIRLAEEDEREEEPRAAGSSQAPRYSPNLVEGVLSEGRMQNPQRHGAQQAREGAHAGPGSVGQSGVRVKGAGMQDLYTEQHARLKRLARGQGITCRTCHSAELRSKGQLDPYVGTGFGVDLWCTNADALLQTILAWEQDDPSFYPRKRYVRQVFSFHAQDDKPAWTWKALRRAHSAACGGLGLRGSGDPRKGQIHPHLAREAIVRDLETTRYGRDYAGRRGKITHVDKDPQTGAATGYVLSMEDGGNEVRFEAEEIRIMEAWG